MIHSEALVDFEFDAKDLLYSRIDRRRKFPATVLLRALGYTDEQLLELFYPTETLDLSACENLETPVEEQTFYRLVDEQVTLDQKATQDILSESGEVLVRANQRIHRRNLNRLVKAGVNRLETNFDEIRGRFLARDVYVDDQKIAECNSMVTENSSSVFWRRMSSRFRCFISRRQLQPVLASEILWNWIDPSLRAVTD